MNIKEKHLLQLCGMALEEDIGDGDVTTLAVVPEDQTAMAYFTTREDCICCGLPIVRIMLGMLDKYLEMEFNVEEGAYCPAGTRLATVSGPARAIMTGERTALNFLQRLSGIATITAKYVEALGKSRTQILDTRKTTPGFRELEKYAVRTGGGHNHRMGLFDRFMIKDNHRELAKMTGPDAIKRAVDACRKYNGKLLVEVEADDLQDVAEAADAGADIILLDNMDNAMIEKAIAIINGRAKTEASGGITLERLPSMAGLGLDYISVGALTHSASAVDIGLDMADPISK